MSENAPADMAFMTGILCVLGYAVLDQATKLRRLRNDVTRLQLDSGYDPASLLIDRDDHTGTPRHDEAMVPAGAPRAVKRAAASSTKAAAV